MNARFLIFLIVVLGFSAISFSQNYADIEIDVQKDGMISIKGPTNYPAIKDILNSQNYTSKKGEYWLFNLTTDEQFDEYIFKLNLPANSQVNYVKVPGNFRLENNDGRIAIIGFGENEPLNILVQYKISYVNYLMSKNTIILVLSGFLVFMIIFSIVLLLKINDMKKRKEISGRINLKGNKSYDITLFTPRQQEIIMIMEKTKKITQKELEERMNIPKSSVSRNIRTLEIKGIIMKERVGNTNYLLLK